MWAEWSFNLIDRFRAYAEVQGARTVFPACSWCRGIAQRAPSSPFFFPFINGKRNTKDKWNRKKTENTWKIILSPSKSRALKKPHKKKPFKSTCVMLQVHRNAMDAVQLSDINAHSKLREKENCYIKQPTQKKRILNSFKYEKTFLTLDASHYAYISKPTN